MLRLFWEWRFRRACTRIVSTMAAHAAIRDTYEHGGNKNAQQRALMIAARRAIAKARTDAMAAAHHIRDAAQIAEETAREVEQKRVRAILRAPLTDEDRERYRIRRGEPPEIVGADSDPMDPKT